MTAALDLIIARFSLDSALALGEVEMAGRAMVALVDAQMAGLRGAK